MRYRSILTKRTVGILTVTIVLSGLSLFQSTVLAVKTAPSPLTVESLAAITPSVNTLTITTANATLATHYGETLTTATLQDAHGQPIVGAVVQFVSTLGTMSPPSATTDMSGKANVIFVAEPMPGLAEITAIYNDVSQSTSLLLETPQVNELDLQISANQLLVEQSLTITVTIRDQFGQPMEGAVASLFGSLGAISSSSSISNDAGQISAVFSAGTVSGLARISALAGYYSQAVALQIHQPISTTANNFIYLPLLIR